MKKIEISARILSGFAGLFVCYSLSIYLFWDSQIALNGFRVDPEHSRITKALYWVLGRDNAKPVGVVLAFLSVHMSWAWRYTTGDIIERLWHKFVKKKPLKIKTPELDDQFYSQEMRSDKLKEASSILEKKEHDTEKLLNHDCVENKK